MNRPRRNLTFTVSGALIAGSFALSACTTPERTNMDPAPPEPAVNTTAAVESPASAPPGSMAPASSAPEQPGSAPEEPLPNANPGPEGN